MKEVQDVLPFMVCHLNRVERTRQGDGDRNSAIADSRLLISPLFSCGVQPLQTTWRHSAAYVPVPWIPAHKVP